MTGATPGVSLGRSADFQTKSAEDGFQNKVPAGEDWSDFFSANRK